MTGRPVLAGTDGSDGVTPAATPGELPDDAMPGTETALRAEVGDTLVIGDDQTGRTPRIGEIIAVPNPDGSPPYRVRWLAGEYESLIFPGPGARIHRGH